MANLTFGESLKTIREVRKLSLREVEEATGISNAYLSQLENDKIKKPSPHFLFKLAKIYDVGYEELMGAVGYILTKEKENEPKTLAGAALWRTKNLSPEEEEALAKYLKFLRTNNKK